MPRYKIKDNRTGREISIKADKPPSAHYARMILSSLENQEHSEQGNSTQYTEPEGGIIPTIGRFSEKPIFGKQGNALDYVTPGLLAGIAPLALGPIGAGVSAGARGLSMLPRALQLAGGLAGRALPTAGYAADIGLLGSEAGLNLQRGNPGTAALNVAGLAGGYLAPTLLARLVGKRTGAAGLRSNPLSDETLPPPAPVKGTNVETPVPAAAAPAQATPSPIIDTPVPAPAPVEDLIPSPTPSVLPAQATLPPATPIGGKTFWTGKAAKASIRTAEQAEIEALSVRKIRQTAVETDSNPLVSPEIKAALDPEVSNTALPFFNMSREGIQGWLKNVKQQETDDLLKALGSEEKVKRFNQLDTRRSSTSNLDTADKASEQFDAEFGNLTPEQEKLVYGTNLPDSTPSAEDLQFVENGLELIELNKSNPQALANTAADSIIGLKSSSKGMLVKSGKGTITDQIHFVLAREALEAISKTGIKQDELHQHLFEAVRLRGGTADDATELLEPFISRKSGSSSRTPTPIKSSGARGELEEFATKHGLELRDEKGRLNLYKGEGKLFSRGFGNAGKMLAGAIKKYAKGEPTFHAPKKAAKSIKAAVKPKVTTQTKLPTGQTVVATRTGQKFIAQSDETAGALEESIGEATKKVNDNIKTDMAEIPPPDLTGRSLAAVDDAELPETDSWLDAEGVFVKNEDHSAFGIGKGTDGKLYLWNTMNGELYADVSGSKDILKLIQVDTAQRAAKLAAKKAIKTRPVLEPLPEFPANLTRIESSEEFLALPKKQQSKWRKLKNSVDDSRTGELDVKDAVVFDIIDEIDSNVINEIEFKPKAAVKPKAETPRKAMADIKTQEEFNALPEEHINELMHTIDSLKNSVSPVLEDPNVIRTVKFIEGYLKKQAEVF